MELLNKLLGNATNISNEELYEKFGKAIAESEEIEFGFSLLREVLVFTDKRLILINIQGMTSKKQEFHSLPYRKISRFSLETIGNLDMDSELKIWISSGSVPTISKRLNKSIDFFAVQRFLAEKVM